MSEKGKIPRGRLGSLSLRKEGERQCFLFSKHLIICTRGSGGKLHLTKVSGGRGGGCRTHSEVCSASRVETWTQCVASDRPWWCNRSTAPESQALSLALP